MRTLVPLMMATLIAAACGGDAASEADSTASEPGAPRAESITAAMVAEGADIFHGRAANGTCFTCHGMDAGGVVGLGPSLADDEWLHSEGSYGAIVKTIRTGVTQPVKHPAPMPAMGGVALTDAQVAAVGAYVYSLSRAEAPQAPR